MSNAIILKNGLLAVTCVAGLTLTACASGQNGSSRYGSVYDYESGGSACQSSACGPTSYTAVYGGQRVIGGQPVSPGVVYADCSVISGMNCNQQQPTQIYTPPTPTYTPSTPTYSPPATTYGETVACPSGTTAAGDGTCMQSGSSYDFSSTTTSTYTGSSSYTGETAPCPAGTTPNGDGTCMEGSGVTMYNNTTTGYVPPVTYTAPTTYLPIRK